MIEITVGEGGEGGWEIEKKQLVITQRIGNIQYPRLVWSTEIVEALPDLTKGSFMESILRQSFEVVKAMPCFG